MVKSAKPRSPKKPKSPSAKTRKGLTYLQAAVMSLPLYRDKSFTMGQMSQDVIEARVQGSKSQSSRLSETCARQAIKRLEFYGKLISRSATDGGKKFKASKEVAQIVQEAGEKFPNGDPNTVREYVMKRVGDVRKWRKIGAGSREVSVNGEMDRLAGRNRIHAMVLRQRRAPRCLAGIPDEPPIEAERQASPTPTEVPDISEVLDVASTISFGIDSELGDRSFWRRFQQERNTPPSTPHRESSPPAMTSPLLSRRSTRSDFSRHSFASNDAAFLRAFSDVTDVDSSHAPDPQMYHPPM